MIIIPPVFPVKVVELDIRTSVHEAGTIWIIHAKELDEPCLSEIPH